MPNTIIRQKAGVAAFIRSLFLRKATNDMESTKRRRIDLGPSFPAYSIYVVGDVHGSLKELRGAENRILQDIAEQRQPGLFILLGDYVDRGPQSSAVLDHLCTEPPHVMRRLPLCGNHDDAFLKFIRSPEKSRGWLEFGGRETLLSYGIDADHILQRPTGTIALADILHRTIPEKHIAFLENLPITATIGNYIFVHAGIRPGLPMEEQSDEDLLWIREPFLTEGSGLSSTVVHGHTISSQPIFSKGRIGIDTAAYMTGKLTILKISGGEATLLEP